MTETNFVDPSFDDEGQDLETSEKLIFQADNARDQGDWGTAVVCYTKALVNTPDSAALWVQLGNVSKEAGDFKEAEQAYIKAAALSPDDSDTYLQMGHLYKLHNDLEAARKNYLHSKMLFPEHPEIDVELANIDTLIVRKQVREGLTTSLSAIERHSSIAENDSERSKWQDANGAAFIESGIVEVVFDLSDLLQYFHNARLPTGIQRVQIEVITSLIFSSSTNCRVRIACFTKESDTWLELPPLFINHICKLSVSGGEIADADWVQVLEELRFHLEKAPTLEFSRGSYLVNIGTSWWLQNYFLHVRHAKAKYGIRYVPFVHDCIPIMTPEHCVEGLTRDFITWALGVFQHADHIFVNSEATASDVMRVANYLGHSIAEPRVITLDADYRAATRGLKASQRSNPSQILSRNFLNSQEYVLFVSTIESRKNHLLAFNAWLRLVKKHGIQRVPKLVCVGNRGWLNDAIYARLASSDILKSKVVWLSKIPDRELEVLYQNCICTLYPSAYEGWGLPVTESLCYGKVPVLSNTTSLPEAGGSFAIYFDPASESELVNAMERVLFDDSTRLGLEAKISKSFAARPWATIAAEIVESIVEWDGIKDDDTDREAISYSAAQWVYKARSGIFHSLTENRETRIWPAMRSGEIYRQGDGWWWPEPWGTWTKPNGATIAFKSEIDLNQDICIFVRLHGIQGKSTQIFVTACETLIKQVTIKADEVRWILLNLKSEIFTRRNRHTNDAQIVEIFIKSDNHVDFRDTSGSLDHRVAAIGVGGFYYCASSDIYARQVFTECLAIDDMSYILDRPEDGTFESLLMDQSGG